MTNNESELYQRLAVIAGMIETLTEDGRFSEANPGLCALLKAEVKNADDVLDKYKDKPEAI